MPYVIKDSLGNIIGLYENKSGVYAEWCNEEDAAVQQYKKTLEVEAQAKNTLESSDLDLIRVIDDLTMLLVKKQVIAFTELPIFAQKKLGARQKMRSDMTSLKSLVGEENEGNMF